MTILFLCSGNTCRSPMAIAAWRSLERCDDKPFGDDVQVRSAGLAAQSAQSGKRDCVPASRHAQKVAKSWGEDLASHRAHGLSSSLLEECDFIITMTDDQARAMRNYFGYQPQQVRCLGEFLPDEISTDEDKRLLALLETRVAPTRTSRDLVDPYGGSLEAYQSCGAQIRSAIVDLRRALRADELSHSEL